MDTPQKDSLNNKSREGIERRSGKERKIENRIGTERREHSHHGHHRHHRRRLRKLKKPGQITIHCDGNMLPGVPFIYTYITGSLPNIIQGII